MTFGLVLRDNRLINDIGKKECEIGENIYRGLLGLSVKPLREPCWSKARRVDMLAWPKRRPLPRNSNNSMI